MASSAPGRDKALTPASALDEEVYYYATWLNQEADMVDERANKQAIEQYAERAAQPISVDHKQVYPFAPLRRENSAVQTVTVGQMITMTAIVLIWTAGLLFFPAQTLVSTIGAITFIYLANLIHTFQLTLRALNTRPEEHIGDKVLARLGNRNWPRYTVLCPLYKEPEVVKQFVQAMIALDYPADRLQIMFLTEVDDDATRDAIQAMRLPPHFEIVTIPDGEPRTKPRACNYGLLRSTGEYVVIYDAEDIPEPKQLKKAVLTFANHGPDLACVQAKLNFYNPRQNVLTRWFTLEYSLWFDLILPGLQSEMLSLPLGGTSNHFRAAILRKLGAWDPFNVTEDCDLGLRLSTLRLHTAMLDSTTYEEANSRPRNWIRQRSRWIKGYMQTYLVHMRRPWRFLHPKRLRELVGLQVVIGGTPATFIVNPLMWLLLALYVFSALSPTLRPIVEPVYHTLYPAPIFYAGLICLIFGNFLYIYMYIIACMKREQYGLMLWSLTIPIYWAMMSIAAMIAVYQLIFKPFYWEKTQHGLHLKYASQQPPMTGADHQPTYPPSPNHP